MKHLLILTIVVGMSGDCAAQIDPLGGAKQPRPQMKAEPYDGQYKRIHQYALRKMLLLEFEEAEAYLRGHLKEQPDDAESHYMLGLMHARLSETNQAAAMFQRAIELGLPPQRIIAGPRGMMRSVDRHAFYRNLVREHGAKPIHGPLVGNVTDQSASVWVRTAEESAVQVIASLTPEFSDAIRSDPVRSTRFTDYTAVADLRGLKPASTYYYAVIIDGGPPVAAEHQKIRTFPRRASRSKFTIAFGGGAGYVPPHERMWSTIDSFEPLALLLLGDNTYVDDPQSIIMQQYTYQRRQSRPEFRRLVGHTAVFSIWDDHDFSTNDSWGGPLVETPFWKRAYSWKIWKDNWANPAYGGGDTQPGCWYEFSIGNVDFIMLDCRYYRTDPRGSSLSMLGPVQKEWLKRTLRLSRASFKVIASSVPWDFRTKGDSLDTWNGYKDEREEVFRFIEDNRIEGVVLMSADRHRSDAWRIERPGSYDFYEFNSSRLTNQHVHPTMQKQGAIFSYNAKQSFGLVEFDTTAADPAVIYKVITIDGEPVHELTVRRSQLTYPKPAR